MMKRSRLLLCLALPILATSRHLEAQRVRVSVGRTFTNDELLGDPLGFTGFLAVPLGTRTALRIGLDWLSDARHRTGIACAGLVDPSACPTEALRDDSDLRGFSVVLARDVLEGERGVVRLMPAVRYANISADTRGLESGNSLSASKNTYGFEAGAEGEVVPKLAWPLSFHVGLGIGTFFPFTKEQVADGYIPFEDGFDYTRIEVGVTIGRRPRPR